MKIVPVKINWHTIPFQGAVAYLAGFNPQLVNQYVHNPTASAWIRFVLACCAAAVTTFHWRKPGATPSPP